MDYTENPNIPPICFLKEASTSSDELEVNEDEFILDLAKTFSLSQESALTLSKFSTVSELYSECYVLSLGKIAFHKRAKDILSSAAIEIEQRKVEKLRG